MKTSLGAGLTATSRFTIDHARTIGFLGEDARVYATPMLVQDIEIAARELLLQHLDPGEDSVGTRVELDHLAASLLGMHAQITVTVTEVKGRLVSFEFEGSDSIDPICRGRHQRFIVDAKTTRARLAAKATKAGLA